MHPSFCRVLSLGQKDLFFEVKRLLVLLLYSYFFHCVLHLLLLHSLLIALDLGLDPEFLSLFGKVLGFEFVEFLLKILNFFVIFGFLFLGS